MDFSGKKRCNFSMRIWTSSCVFIQSSILVFCYEEIHNVFTVLDNCFVTEKK